MYTGLMIIAGLFWSLTYVLIIRRGFKDKTYGMPLAALCAPGFSNKKFYAMFILALITSFCLVLFITDEFSDRKGAYAAFGQNLMMSVLFIVMLYRRDDLRGQSIFIALFKMLGTGISSLAFYLYQPISQGSKSIIFRSGEIQESCINMEG